MKNCHKIRTEIISENITADIEQHLVVCETCRALYQDINNAMSILDMDAPVPEKLAEKILARKNELNIPKSRKLNYMSIIQIAAAIMFGIFIGHQFGMIAKKNAKQIQKDPVDQYFEAHHFTVNHPDFKSPSIFTKN